VPVRQCTERVSGPLAPHQYPRRVQRHALGLLFAGLAAALAAVAGYALAGADDARRLVVGLAAVAVAAWLATLSASAFRSRGR
jgi:hypothetical protein